MPEDIVGLLYQLFPYCRITQCREAGRVVRLELAVSLLAGREAEAISLPTLKKLVKVLDKPAI